MRFRRVSIGGGDRLYTPCGKIFVVSDWSEGTGDIYGALHLPVSMYGLHRYISHHKVEERFGPLSWNVPFLTSRVLRLTPDMRVGKQG